MDKIYNSLIQKEAKLAVVGLGYVGLPIALAFARKISVVGFDINQKRVDMMRNHQDPSEELGSEEFEHCDITFTADPQVLRQASFFIVAVPTPIDEHNLPDLKPLLAATRTVAGVLKKGDYVVFESTVYPGCTEEDCLPLLEEISGLKCGTDFKLGYSPERINPGDREHTLARIIKVVSGSDAVALEQIALTYQIVVDAGVHRASSIKVAEAAKIIENTQRDLNIALMNELSMIFGQMGIPTYDVLEAAGTKWNFLRFLPGLVGGHCIGVDPYYLTHKAKEVGHNAQVILAGRSVNDGMGAYVAGKVVKKLIANGVDISEGRVLVMGATFKENVSDIRNSKVADVVKELKDFGLKVEVIDPHADSDHMQEEYGFGLTKGPDGKYDAIIVAVNHQEYTGLPESWFAGHTNPGGILADIKGIYRNKISELTYWSL
jgi:UDP-N-acetyl-D-glucosamine/UDP-N-acetyl-D-galactosamine dehydrogenase